jgi:hypothetical protein
LPRPAIPVRSIVLSHGYIGLLRPVTSLRIIGVYNFVVVLPSELCRVSGRNGGQFTEHYRMLAAAEASNADRMGDERRGQSETLKTRREY